MQLGTKKYSYRSDQTVPKFSDRGPFTVMDAQCSVCARGAKWIARNDHAHDFKIIPLQSKLGNALMCHYGLNPDDPLSWLYLEDGVAYGSLEAVIKVGVRLGGKWRALRVLRILPRPLQDALYGFVARRRYKFGNAVTICNMPDADVRERILE